MKQTTNETEHDEITGKICFKINSKQIKEQVKI
jgi:hypothetical protein